MSARQVYMPSALSVPSCQCKSACRPFLVPPCELPVPPRRGPVWPISRRPLATAASVSCRPMRNPYTPQSTRPPSPASHRHASLRRFHRAYSPSRQSRVFVGFQQTPLRRKEQPFLLGLQCALSSLTRPLISRVGPLSVHEMGSCHQGRPAATPRPEQCSSNRRSGHTAAAPVHEGSPAHGTAQMIADFQCAAIRPSWC